MKFLLVLFFLLAGYITGYSQDTPYIKPVTYTPQGAAGYQFKQVKVDSSAQIKKLLVQDTAGFKGKVFVPTPPSGDSSKTATNSAWVRKYIAENVTPGTPGTPTPAWQYRGNYSDAEPTHGLLGFLDSFPVQMITNGAIRLIIPDNGIKRNAGAGNKVLTIDTVTKKIYYTDMGSSGASGVTSVTFGYGLTGGTITSTGTGKVDTSVIATVARLLSDSAYLKALIDANATAIGGKLDISALPAKMADSLINYVNAVDNISPLLNFSISNRRLTPSLQNVAANTVFGNHTGSTGAPSFAKLPVASISATGTPSGTTVLYGNGTWAVPPSSPWNIDANGIDYTAGNVGIGINLPTSKWHLVSNSLGATTTTLTDNNFGALKQNTTASTLGNPQNSPTDAFLTTTYNTSTSASEAIGFRTMVQGLSAAGGNANLLFQRIYSGVVANVLTINAQNASATFGGSATIQGITSNGNISSTGSITAAVSSIVNQGITGTGSATYNMFLYNGNINSTGGTKEVNGFYFNPTNTSLTGTTVYAFRNTSGINLFNSTSGSAGFGTTSIDASAKVQIDATDKGVLMPRMTSSQRTSIGSPASGLIVYDTDLKGLYFYDGQWLPVNNYSINTTTTGLSSATLNSTYPNVPVGHRVICGAITLGGAIYTKYSEAGSSDVWLMTSAPVQP